MIYDTFVQQAQCKGCEKTMHFFINGEYPICPVCMRELIDDFKKLIGTMEEVCNES